MKSPDLLLPLFISAAVVIGCRPALQSTEPGENRRPRVSEPRGDSRDIQDGGAVSGVWKLVEFNHRGIDRASEFENRVLVVDGDLATTVITVEVTKTVETKSSPRGVPTVYPSRTRAPVQARIQLVDQDPNDGIVTLKVMSFGGVDRGPQTLEGEWVWVGRWQRTGDELAVCLNLADEGPPPDLSPGDDRLLLRFRRGRGELPEARSLVDIGEFDALVFPFLGPPGRSPDKPAATRSSMIILDYGPTMLAKQNSRPLWSRAVDYVISRVDALQPNERLTVAAFGQRDRVESFTVDERRRAAQWLGESRPHRRENLLSTLRGSAETLRRLQPGADLTLTDVDLVFAPQVNRMNEGELLSHLDALRQQCRGELTMISPTDVPSLPNISISGVRPSEHPIVPGRRVQLDVEVTNHGDRRASFVLECKYGNERVASQPVSLDGGSRYVLPVSFRCAGGAERRFAAMLRNADDEINAIDLDDRTAAPVLPSGKRSILLVRAGTEGNSKFFLKVALTALNGALNGEFNGREERRPLAIHEMDPSEFTTCDTDQFDLAIIDGLSQVTPSQRDQLARFLRDGTPVWICLARDADTQLVRRIRRPLGAADLVAFPFEIAATRVSEGPHRKMLPTESGKEFFGGEKTSSWSYIKKLLESDIYVRDYCRLRRLQAEDAGWITLFESDEGEPLVIVGELGNSPVVISAFPYDETSSTFPSHQFFLLFVDRMLAHLMSAPRELVAFQGDDIVFHERRPKSTLSVSLPNGVRTPYERLDSALLPKTYEEPGVYRFSLVAPSGERRESAVCVAVPKNLSQLRFADEQFWSLSKRVGFSYETLKGPLADSNPIDR